jgi:hypothetical protein
MLHKFLKEFRNVERIGNAAKKQGRHMNNATRQRALTVIRQAREMTGNKHTPATSVVPKARKLAAALIIQRRYRKPITNEKFIKLLNRTKTPPWMTLLRHANATRGTYNLNLTRNLIYNERHRGKNNVARTIQGAFARYAHTKHDVVYDFIMRLYEDKELKFYGGLLNRLFTMTTAAVQLMNQTERNNFALRKNIVTRKIGHCHMAKANIPRKYLGRMYAQLVYVARAFKRMKEPKKVQYLERLKRHITVGPCLENALESLIEALVEPVFEWRGKMVQPLNKNNSRYLTHVIGPALSSWVSSNKNLSAKVEAKIRRNYKGNLNAMNTVESNSFVERKKLGELKKLFWNTIKNRPLHVMTNEGPMYSRPRNYNANGKRFRNSNQAKSLEYF